MLHQPKPDEAPDLLAGIIAIRKMHIRAIEESGLQEQMRCSIPKIEVILTIFCLMRQSGKICGKSAASSDSKCDGYTCRNEKSDKRRFFCNAQFCSGSTEFSFFIYRGMDVTTEEMIWHMSYCAEA